MELHRLDGLALEGTMLDGSNIAGFSASGLDNVDIQDVDYEALDEDNPEDDLMNGQQFQGLEALGYVQDPEIVYEIQDEAGNVVLYADADENLYVIDGLGELGFFKKIGRGLKNASKFVRKKVVKPTSRFVSRKVVKPTTQAVSRAAKYTGRKILTPAVKTFNRYANPATILLRNGFLLAMKINMLKVAERLRFGYLSDSEARRRRVSMSGFSKLKSAVQKAEKIYELAGGKKENLKKAILTGKGNSDKAVPLSGLDLGNPAVDLDEFVDPFERLIVESDPDDVEALLEETVEMEGLGAVVTGSALAAASGAVASVAAVLSKITGVFDQAKQVRSDAKSLVSPSRSLPIKNSAPKSTPATVVRPLPKPLTRFTPRPTTTSLIRKPLIPPRRLPAPAPKPSIPSKVPARTASASVPKLPLTVTVSEDANDKPGFFQKNKTPIIIGAGVLVAGGGIYYAVKQSKKKPKERSIDGIQRDDLGRFTSPKKTRKKKRSTKRKARKKVKKLVPTVLL